MDGCRKLPCTQSDHGSICLSAAYTDSSQGFHSHLSTKKKYFHASIAYKIPKCFRKRISTYKGKKPHNILNSEAINYYEKIFLQANQGGNSITGSLGGILHVSVPFRCAGSQPMDGEVSFCQTKPSRSLRQLSQPREMWDLAFSVLIFAPSCHSAFSHSPFRLGVWDLLAITSVGTFSSFLVGRE